MNKKALDHFKNNANALYGKTGRGELASKHPEVWMKLYLMTDEEAVDFESGHLAKRADGGGYDLYAGDDFLGTYTLNEAATVISEWIEYEKSLG